jgi:hypothetical protein
MIPRILWVILSDYSVLPDRSNGAFKLLQREMDVGVGMGRGE